MGTFAADAYFSPSPGYVYKKVLAIANTTDDALYQTERSATTNNGTFNYSIPVANGQYTVVLHFAELYWTAQAQRIFDVSIEGAKVLDNFDIIKDAGGALKAIKKAFVTDVTDGTISIYFSALKADGGVNRPKVSAIEVFSGSTAVASASVVDDEATSPVHIAQKLAIAVRPNPSNNNFNISLSSTNKAPVMIRVTDLLGRTVEVMKQMPAASNFTLGANYNPGVYILEAVQGTERVTMKLVKTKR
jgi:hypothetical protein